MVRSRLQSLRLGIVWLFPVQEFPKSPQKLVADSCPDELPLSSIKCMIRIRIIVNPRSSGMLPAHARNHDGHREGPEGLSGDGVEGTAKSGPDQRCNAQASAAAGE